MKKILKRLGYFLLLLLLGWLALVQCNWFDMRIADSEWAAELRQHGQLNSPQFLDIPLNGTRHIHAVAVRRGDSLPLVMLVHGSPGASDAFLDYLADSLLTQNANLVTIDRPGFGYSSGYGQPEPSQANQAAAVKAVAEQLAPGQKVWLVGHSLGAPVIARFAMDYPELTAGLVFVAGSIDPAQETHPWWQSAINVPPLAWLTPKPLWTSNAEIIPLVQELTYMLPLWERIRCPVRVIHAQNDQLVPVANAAFAQRMLKNCSDLQVHILPTGDHFILWSRPDIIRQAILDLIKK